MGRKPPLARGREADLRLGSPGGLADARTAVSLPQNVTAHWVDDPCNLVCGEQVHGGAFYAWRDIAGDVFVVVADILTPGDIEDVENTASGKLHPSPSPAARVKKRRYAATMVGRWEVHMRTLRVAHTAATGSKAPVGNLSETTARTPAGGGWRT
jgi:hypothetical protein